MNDDEPVGLENISVVVKDINAMQKRYDKLQARIDAVEILGLSTTEYEKEEQKLSKANIIFDMYIDLWEDKEKS